MKPFKLFNYLFYFSIHKDCKKLTKLERIENLESALGIVEGRNQALLLQVEKLTTLVEQKLLK